MLVPQQHATQRKHATGALAVHAPHALVHRLGVWPARQQRALAEYADRIMCECLWYHIRHIHQRLYTR